MLHPNDPSESISRGNRSNHESLWDAKFVKALHSRSTRLETVPFNARRYSRETPSPIVLAEKEEEEEESIRGEKRRGRSTRRNKRVEDRGRRVMQGLRTDCILFPPLPFHPLNQSTHPRPLYPQLHKLLSAGWLRMRGLSLWKFKVEMGQTLSSSL